MNNSFSLVTIFLVFQISHFSIPFLTYHLNHQHQHQHPQSNNHRRRHLKTQAEYKKYSEYSLPVDPDQDDKATVIRLCNFSRPHMRAFHCSWIGFFIAFFIWFAIAPLLGEIRDDLGLTKQEVWTSSIAGVGGTIFMRFILGPMCDKWGARIPMGKSLFFSSIYIFFISLLEADRWFLLHLEIFSSHICPGISSIIQQKMNSFL